MSAVDSEEHRRAYCATLALGSGSLLRILGASLGLLTRAIFVLFGACVALVSADADLAAKCFDYRRICRRSERSKARKKRKEGE